MPVFPKMGNTGMAAWEGCEIVLNTYLIECPKGQSDCAPQSGAIMKIVILTPQGGDKKPCQMDLIWVKHLSLH